MFRDDILDPNKSGVSLVAIINHTLAIRMGGKSMLQYTADRFYLLEIL